MKYLILLTACAVLPACAKNLKTPEYRSDVHATAYKTSPTVEVQRAPQSPNTSLEARLARIEALLEAVSRDRAKETEEKLGYGSCHESCNANYEVPSICWESTKSPKPRECPRAIEDSQKCHKACDSRFPIAAAISC